MTQRSSDRRIQTLSSSDSRITTLSVRDYAKPYRAAHASGGASLAPLMGAGLALVSSLVTGDAALQEFQALGSASALVTGGGSAALQPLAGQGEATVTLVSPAHLSAVVGWLRVAEATVVGSNFTLPDVLGGPPATQGTLGAHPTIGTSANGLPILQFGGSAFLFHALDSLVNNNANYFGIGAWMRSPLSAANRVPYSIRSAAGGASAHRIVTQIVSTEDVLADLYINNANGRRGRSAANAVGNNVWDFWTYEYQASLSGDARFIITKNNALVGLTYSAFAGTAPEMPAALPTPTGFGFLGSTTTTPTNPFIGDMGDMYFFSRQLTSPERAGLIAFEARA